MFKELQWISRLDLSEKSSYSEEESDRNDIDRGFCPDMGPEFEIQYVLLPVLDLNLHPLRFVISNIHQEMDSPWDENPEDTTARDVEWSRISTEFTNVGYREGIISGKEAASQEGFDFGFANVGVPIGRELGLLRGISSVLLGFLKNAPPTPENERMLAEAQDISIQLSNVRFSDIMPRDLEAEEHAREHLEAEGMELDTHEDIAAKRDIEGIEDMLANMSAGNGETKNVTVRPTAEDVQALKRRLGILSDRLDLDIKWT